MMMLTIEPDDNPHCCVDSSYAVHPDMKSHTGIFMSIGKGGGYMASSKQKFELVAIDDAMGQILWMQIRVYQYLLLPYTKTTKAPS